MKALAEMLLNRIVLTNATGRSACGRHELNPDFACVSCNFKLLSLFTPLLPIYMKVKIIILHFKNKLPDVYRHKAEITKYSSNR